MRPKNPANSSHSGRILPGIAFALTLAGLMLVGMSLTSGSPAAHADGNILLHNSTADATTDCPDTVNAYWHFVLAPNDGSFAFVTLHLNIGGSVMDFSGSAIIKNGTQSDNIFIEVPSGHTLSELSTTNSSADFSGTGTPNEFNLSSVCTGSATATATSTATATATNTSVPTNTPTVTDTPIGEVVESPTPTSTATNTATATNTPVNTDTPTATMTNTPVNTDTPTATGTVPTATNTPLNTDTPTATGTVPTATNTPVNTDTPTATGTVPTNTPTATETTLPGVTPVVIVVVPTDTPVSGVQGGAESPTVAPQQQVSAAEQTPVSQVAGVQALPSTGQAADRGARTEVLIAGVLLVTMGLGTLAWSRRRSA